jgi:hypothetical protein
MQLAAAVPAAMTPAEALTDVVHQQQQQQQLLGLRLASYAGFPGDTNTLAALPAHSLTHLDLNFKYSSGIGGAALSAALARLSNPAAAAPVHHS